MTDPLINNQNQTLFTAPSPDLPPDEPEKMMFGDMSLLRFPDGSALANPIEDEDSLYPDRMQGGDFNENLALFLPDDELRDIGNSLKDAVEDDAQSQENYFQAVAKTVEMLGIGLVSEEGDDNLPFKGAAAVHSSAMFESMVDIVASAQGSLFPATGMVDTVIMGEASDEAQNIAYRMKEWFNYYFDEEAKEFRKEALRAIEWAVISGSVYKKVYICPVLGRPVSNCIPIEDFIVNRSHSSHLAASRKTHILRLSPREYEMRVMMGMYRDIHVLKTEQDEDGLSVIKEQLNLLSGYDPSGNSYDDAGYVFCESHTDYRIKSDPYAKGNNMPMPYIICFERQSGTIVSIHRNWKEKDPNKTRREFFVNFSFLTSLDGEGYGLANYAAGLAEAATNVTRQIMNSATYANFPGGVYQAGIRIENNNLRPAPGEFVPIHAPGPVSEAFQTLPYKEPSQTLQTLKDQLEDSIRKPSAIINHKISEMTANAPVGSVLAMLENLQKVPNAILQGFHESLTREFGLFFDRFAEWLPDNQPYPFVVPGGQHFIIKNDFTSGVKVMPSSDPSAKNSTYRLMQSEIILSKATQFPDIHNLEFAFRFFYKNIGLSEEDTSQLLSKKDNVEPPKPMDPVSTIMALGQGQPVTAAPWQDHAAYITIIDTWMQQNPQSPQLQAALALKQQHESLKYMVDTYAQLGIAPPEDPSQLSPDEQNNLAVHVAQIKLQEAQQLAAQQTPPEPPLDPARAALQAAQMQMDSAHEKHEVDMQKIELDRQKAEMDFALKTQEFDLKSKEYAKKSELDEFKVTHEQALKERDQALKERDQLLEETEIQSSLVQ